MPAKETISVLEAIKRGAHTLNEIRTAAGSSMAFVNNELQDLMMSGEIHREIKDGRAGYYLGERTFEKTAATEKPSEEVNETEEVNVTIAPLLNTDGATVIKTFFSQARQQLEMKYKQDLDALNRTEQIFSEM